MDVVALKDQLILLRLRLADGDAIEHVYVPHNLRGHFNIRFPDKYNVAHLLTQEVTDLQLASAILNDAVDGKVGIDSAHLVLETLKRSLLLSIEY